MLGDGETQLKVLCQVKCFQTVREILHQKTWLWCHKGHFDRIPNRGAGYAYSDSPFLSLSKHMESLTKHWFKQWGCKLRAKPAVCGFGILSIIYHAGWLNWSLEVWRPERKKKDLNLGRLTTVNRKSFLFWFLNCQLVYLDTQVIHSHTKKMEISAVNQLLPTVGDTPVAT